MDSDEDEYGFAVELRHPDRPTVRIGLSWEEEQHMSVLQAAAVDLVERAVEISARMGGIT